MLHDLIAHSKKNILCSEKEKLTIGFQIMSGYPRTWIIVGTIHADTFFLSEFSSRNTAKLEFVAPHDTFNIFQCLKAF